MAQENCFSSLQMVKLTLATLFLGMCIVAVHSHGIPNPHTKQTLSLRSTLLRQSYLPNHIYFAADDSAKLFVNGVYQLSVSRWEDFAYTSLNVRHGDVISIVASDPGGYWWGAIAELYVNGRYYATGRDDWRARKKFTSSNYWMLKSYPQSEACKWHRAVLRPSPAIWQRGKAVYFKSNTAARYVWASDAGMHDTIFMRLVVGGQSCSTLSRITFAGDDRAELYVNGVFQAATSLYHEFAVKTVRLDKGDVVALKVKDTHGGWWGAIAAIQSIGTSATGKDDWRAVKAFKIVGDVNAWMYPSYDACRWPLAKLLPGAGRIFGGKAPKFPYSSTGAEYVWASNAGAYHEIFLRTVVGGQC